MAPLCQVHLCTSLSKLTRCLLFAVCRAAFMVLLLLPIAYFLPGQEGAGLHENTLETLHMIGSSHQLQIVLATDMIALLAYNFCGMMVTGHLGAVFRTVLETMRTLFVWLLGLLLFYTPLVSTQVHVFF